MCGGGEMHTGQPFAILWLVQNRQRYQQPRQVVMIDLHLPFRLPYSVLSLAWWVMAEGHPVPDVTKDSRLLLLPRSKEPMHAGAWEATCDCLLCLGGDGDAVSSTPGQGHL